MGTELEYESLSLSLSVATVDLSMKVMEGSTIQLLCHFPHSSQVTVNAQWYKESDNVRRTKLNLDESSPDGNRVEQLYPLDHDQTILIRNVVMEDAGIYTCESPAGEKLSTIYMTVEGTAIISVFYFEPVMLTANGCLHKYNKHIP